MKYNKGFSQILLLGLGLVFLLIAIPLTGKLVSQRQEIRKQARVEEGACGECQKEQTKRECHEEKTTPCLKYKQVCNPTTKHVCVPVCSQEEQYNCRQEPYPCKSQNTVCDEYNQVCTTSSHPCVVGREDDGTLIWGMSSTHFFVPESASV